MKFRLIAAAVAALFFHGTSLAADESFDISGFEVQGNSILSQQQIDHAVGFFTGKGRVYGDIQKALEALEQTYRDAGYNTVQVFVTEQELTGGVVRFLVTEAVIGQVVITGNEKFSEQNVRASLPELKEGKAPNARQLSENIQLVNDNPAKQVEVTLALGEDEGKVDAKVKVTEQPPRRVYLTVDDTGSGATGHIRTGVAYQNANLLGGDETLTLAYTTSPDAPSGVDVDIYSLALRIPFYSIGDSLDIIYGDSNVNTPISQATAFNMTGKGQVLAIRWNHYFAREGEYSSKLVFGYDYKFFNTKSSSFPVHTPLQIAPFTPHTTRPLSVTYQGQWQGVDYAADFNVGVAYNLPMGTNWPVTVGSNRTDHYSFIAKRPADDEFLIYRYGGSYMLPVGAWQLRAAASGQWTQKGLVPGEQIGLAGSTAVRGFSERAVATDTGFVLNVEAYSPELQSLLSAPGNLRGVIFYDVAHGWNNSAVAPDPARAGLASWGLGLRYAYNKSTSLKLDVAQVIDHGPVANVQNGEVRGHFSLSVGF